MAWCLVKHREKFTFHLYLILVTEFSLCAMAVGYIATKFLGKFKTGL